MLYIIAYEIVMCYFKYVNFNLILIFFYVGNHIKEISIQFSSTTTKAIKTIGLK